MAKRSKEDEAAEVSAEWRGEEQLRGLLVPVDSLKADPDNARLHPTRNMQAITDSLARFGQQKPIVVAADGVVIAGNGTMEAAVQLGWTEIAAVRTKLTAAEARAFAIADNKTGDLAEWDFQALSSIFLEMDEDLRKFTGFADFEIEPLIAADWTPPQISDEPEEKSEAQSVRFSAEEWEAVAPAVERIRERDGLADATTAAAVALICGEWASVG